jgi:hypothetical protein
MGVRAEAENIVTGSEAVTNVYEANVPARASADDPYAYEPGRSISFSSYWADIREVIFGKYIKRTLLTVILISTQAFAGRRRRSVVLWPTDSV